MSKRKVFLEKIHIKNYLSLRDVTLPLKPLTVLVGPNASGKSNICHALHFLNMMLVDDKFYSDKLSKNTIWAGEARKIAFQLQTKVNKKEALYRLEVEPRLNFPFHTEQLSVDDGNVISIQDGHGVVWDENGENETKYSSNELALGSAGNYGIRPVTRALAEFIKRWQFYDFVPDDIRSYLTGFLPAEKEFREFPKLDRYGENLADILWIWYKHLPNQFQNINDALYASTDREIDFRQIDHGQSQLSLLEEDKDLIPLISASDGILRLIAYYTLLNEPELPPLIAIEEPERNLHPGALSDIANVLEQIAEYSQVIITTHSSELLGAFNSESLGHSLGVLLLRNRPGVGTTVLNLEDYRSKRKALAGWIADFGIGSAVFDSGLLPDQMEDTAECQA